MAAKRRGELAMPANPPHVAAPYFQTNMPSTSSYNVNYGFKRKQSNFRYYHNQHPRNEAKQAKTEKANGAVDDFKCPACLRPFDLMTQAPYILGCNHTLCESCALRFIIQDQLKCSVCSKSTQIDSAAKQNRTLFNHLMPNYGIIGRIFWMSKNFDISSIRFKSGCNPPETHTNDACQHCPRPTTTYCLTCETTLCERCVKTHDAEHSMFTPQLANCELHPNLKNYVKCVECAEAVCPECMLQKHKGHDYNPINQLDTSDRDEFAHMMVTCKRKLALLQTAKTDIISYLTAEERRRKDVRANWYAVAEFLIATADESPDETIRMLTDSKTRCTFYTKLLARINEHVQQVWNGQETVASLDVSAIRERMAKIDELPFTHCETEEDPASLNSFNVAEIANIVKNSITNSSEVKYKLVKGESDAPPIPRPLACPDDIIEIDDEDIEVMELEPVEPSPDEIEKLLDVKITNQELVDIVHVVDSHEIYIHYKKQQSAIDLLHAQLLSAVTDGRRCDEAQLKGGEIYLVRNFLPCFNYAWVRAYYVGAGMRHQQREYKVKFVDFGCNFTIFKLNSFRTLSEDLKKVPSLAVRCQIHDFHQRKGSKLKEYFQEIITPACKIFMVKYKENNAACEVDFIVNHDEGSFSIRDTMVLTDYGSITPRDETKLIKQETEVAVNNFRENNTCFMPGDLYDVHVTHIDSPHAFYITLCRSEKYYQQMSSELNAVYSKIDLKHKFIYDPRVGIAVAVQHNMRWHRGIIKTPKLPNGMYGVFLVDSGQMVDAAWRDLRKLVEQFFAAECQAIRARLADVTPSDGAWSHAAIDGFRNLMRSDGVYQLVVRSSAPQLIITLNERFALRTVSINALLVERGYAVSSGDLSHVIKQCTISEATHPKNDTVDITLGLLNLTQGKRTFGDDEDDADDVEFDGKRCECVFVLNVITPGELYIHRIEDDAHMRSLHDLNTALQEYYTMCKLETKEMYAVDDFVIAYDSDKNSYFRARIIALKQDDAYECLSIDYGHCFTVALSQNIGELQGDDFSIDTHPGYAECCSLYGIRPLDGETWPLTARDLLIELLVGKTNVYAMHIADMDGCSVVLWKKTKIIGGALESNKLKICNVNKQLVGYGLAMLHEWNLPLREMKVVAEQDSDSDSDDDVIEVIDDQKGVWTAPTKLLGHPITGTVTWVDATGHIYFTLDCDQKRIEEICNEMTCVLNAEPDDISIPLEANDRCAARFELDGRWYRAVVVCTPESEDDTYTVCMIDYGNVENVPRSDLHSRVMFDNTPTLAHRVRLHGLTAARLDNKDLEYFHGKIVSKHVFVQIECESLRPPSAVVKLKGQDMNAYFNAYLKDKANKNRARSKKYRVKPLPDQSRFHVCVENTFGRSHSIIFSLHGLENMEREGFEDAIFAQGDAQPPLDCYAPDTPCLARFSGDGRWYRARVVSEYPAKKCVFVLFIDYGNSEYREAADLRMIRDEWLAYDVEVYVAELNVVPPEKDTPAEETLERCLDGIVEKCRVELEVVRKDPLTIHLYDVNTHRLLYQELIDNKIITVK